jgi:hypothetical protein
MNKKNLPRPIAALNEAHIRRGFAQEFKTRSEYMIPPSAAVP